MAAGHVAAFSSTRPHAPTPRKLPTNETNDDDDDDDDDDDEDEDDKDEDEDEKSPGMRGPNTRKIVAQCTNCARFYTPVSRARSRPTYTSAVCAIAYQAREFSSPEVRVLSRRIVNVNCFARARARQLHGSSF